MPNHPLPVGTRVALDIAQGHAVGEAMIRAAEFDDGWLYRVEVVHGRTCNDHRNDDGALWVWDFEVTPLGEG